VTRYRVGGSWRRHTIVLEGAQSADENGRRADDQVVAFVDSAAPEGLAARICDLLNDSVGPCSSSLPHLHDSEFGTFCELRHGHAGDHEAGPTRWREVQP